MIRQAFEVFVTTCVCDTSRFQSTLWNSSCSVVCRFLWQECHSWRHCVTTEVPDTGHQHQQVDQKPEKSIFSAVAIVLLPAPLSKKMESISPTTTSFPSPALTVSTPGKTDSCTRIMSDSEVPVTNSESIDPRIIAMIFFSFCACAKMLGAHKICISV